MTTPAPETPTDAEKKRRQRNWAIALVILAFVAIVYAVTILRLGANVAQRPF
ncbi:MAG: hypothetical protein K2Q06_16455 [Parvularculaceae bacterium]|nr:hypothetical protein [Parvularculaceae bacterium]